jgi:hypothetical protein
MASDTFDAAWPPIQHDIDRLKKLGRFGGERLEYLEFSDGQEYTNTLERVVKHFLTAALRPVVHPYSPSTGTQIAFDEYEARLASYRSQFDEAIELLRSARFFIKNGVEFGYIRMPDEDTPDPAHETLPSIETFLSRQSTTGAGE